MRDFSERVSLRGFRERLKQALGQGAALATVSWVGCGGAVVPDTGSAGTSSAVGGVSGSATISGTPGPAGLAGGSAIGGGGATGDAGTSAIGGTTAEGGAGALGTVGAADSAGDGGAIGLPPSGLPPYADDQLTCTGGYENPDGGFGFHGQCCASLVCSQPQGGACVAPSRGSYGSGQCLCGSIDGPYKPSPAATNNAPCCYIVHALGCDGRPLLVDGDPVLSALIGSADWLSPDLLALLAA